MSTQYKIILNRRGKGTWPILKTDIRQSPDLWGAMAEGTVRWSRIGCL